MLVDAAFRLVEGTPEPRCPLGNRSEDVQAWKDVHGQQVLQFGTDDLPLFKHAATQRRVLSYLRGAIDKGATLPLVDLIKRALSRFGLERGERMIRHYIAAVRTDPSLYVFKARCGRSFVLFFRSRTRAKRPDATPRRTQKRPQNSPCNGYLIGSLKGLKSNAGAGSGLSRLRGFAFALARICARRHWDNCKVRWSNRHAFNFCFRWLRAGRLTEDILSAYDSALHQRHKDATDFGLNNDCAVEVRWELSSTVSLADTLLSQVKAPTTWFSLMGSKVA